jgi:DNA gyrase inhibitor GyrI
MKSDGVKELDVQIVRLAPMRVAAFLGFGSEPEMQAWARLEAWAKPKGFFDQPDQHRIFGFNNPDPAPGSPNYGYEFWIEIGRQVEAEGEMEIKTIPGNLYAVTRCDASAAPGEIIPAAWQKLVEWREASAYRQANHQWLEQHLEPLKMMDGQLVLNLFLPVSE